MEWKRALRLPGIATLGLIAMGCVEVEPFGQGTLEVNWAVAPLGCEELGVSEVQVTLSNTSREVLADFPCVDRRGELAGLPPGTYSLRLEGLDERGQALFGAPERDVFLRPDEVTRAAIVDLVALPAALQVSWYFENQRVCGANGVDAVEIAVFDQGFYEVARGRYDCDLGAVPVDGLRAGEVWVQARGVGSDQSFEGLAAAALKQGGEASVDIVLHEITLQ